MSEVKQLSLAVNLPDDETFDSYFAANSVLLDSLQSFILGKQNYSSIYMFGGQGVGKSHLLHACCAYAETLGISSICLSLRDCPNYPLALLDGLDNVNLVCLDDVDALAENPTWQQAIFDLFNRVNEQDNKLIITGADSVSQLPLTLKDLMSRLQWGLIEQVKPLTDDDKIVVLRERAKARGIEINQDVAKFLLTRLSRNMRNLIECLDVLDKVSIQEQRKITIPFIKNVLMNK